MDIKLYGLNVQVSTRTISFINRVAIKWFIFESRWLDGLDIELRFKDMFSSQSN